MSPFAKDFEFVPPSLCNIEGWIAAAAIVGGAAIGAVGSVVAGGEQASGQEAAANTQAGMFNTVQGIEAPYVSQGNAAETTLGQLLGTSAGTGANGAASGTNLPAGYLTQTFNPTTAQLENYPGYQFQLQQGDLATQNAASATGGAISGAAMKQLSTFNQGLAASNYSNYFNQFQTQQNNIFDRLSTIAGLGQSAASTTANSGTQLGTGIAQAQAAAAGATAAGTVGATNALGNAGSTLGLLSVLGANGLPPGTNTGTDVTGSDVTTAPDDFLALDQ